MTKISAPLMTLTHPTQWDRHRQLVVMLAIRADDDQQLDALQIRGAFDETMEGGPVRWVGYDYAHQGWIEVVFEPQMEAQS